MLDPAGNEIVRHAATGFLGEMNLLSGQTVYLRAVATQPMRYIAVEREALRELLTEESQLANLLHGTFIVRREALQRREGVGVEVVGPRSSAATRELVSYLRRTRLPHTWSDTDRDPELAMAVAGVETAALPLVRLPGGEELRAPSLGQVSRALGIELELAAWEEVDLLVVGGGPAGLGAAVYAVSEGCRPWWSSRRRSVARPARRDASRTTSGSRPASAAPS